MVSCGFENSLKNVVIIIISVNILVLITCNLFLGHFLACKINSISLRIKTNNLLFHSHTKSQNPLLWTIHSVQNVTYKIHIFENILVLHHMKSMPSSFATELKNYLYKINEQYHFCSVLYSASDIILLGHCFILNSLISSCL